MNYKIVFKNGKYIIYKVKGNKEIFIEQTNTKDEAEKLIITLSKINLI